MEKKKIPGSIIQGKETFPILLVLFGGNVGQEFRPF